MAKRRKKASKRRSKKRAKRRVVFGQAAYGKKRKSRGPKKFKAHRTSNKIPLAVLDKRARRLGKTVGGRHLIKKIKEIY